MDAYTRFLTLENVRNFILFVIENDLFCNEFIIGFFVDLLQHGHRYDPAHANSCTHQCVICCDVALSIVPSVVTHLCLCPIHTTNIFVCHPLLYCFDISPKNNLQTCLDMWKLCGVACGNCIADGVCCRKCVRTHLDSINNNSYRFLSIVQATLLQPKHRRVLLNYPPYVEYTISSSIFGNNAWRQQGILNPTNFTIQIPYSENAFFDFILSPTHQMQIVSHAMTYGSNCCEFCGNVDAHWMSLLSPIVMYNRPRNALDASNYLQDWLQFGLQNGQIRTFSIHNPIFFGLVRKYRETHTHDILSFHTILCKICAYRDFLTFYPRMKCILPLLHEEIYHNFDRQCVVNHVFGNEYVAKQIFNFL